MPIRQSRKINRAKVHHQLLSFFSKKLAFSLEIALKIPIVSVFSFLLLLVFSAMFFLNCKVAI